MGVNLKDIIPKEGIRLEALDGKVLAIDAPNTVYQFLSSVRQPDGTPLMDSHGNVTSHISGLFYRTVRFIGSGIKPVYVFDGKPPELKREEIERRRGLKEESRAKYETAMAEGRTEDARKYAMRTSRFTKEMAEESKELLGFMGVPYVQSPAEGEAQCSHMCQRCDAWAVASQDYDALLLGAPRLVRGLASSGNPEIEMIKLDEALKGLGVSRSQLIDIAILVGTDFSPGVKGIGPKKALKAVREGNVGSIKVDFDMDAAREIFLHPEVTEDYKIEWKHPDVESLVSFLCEKHDFSPKRVRSTAGNLEAALKRFSQKSLDSWF
ncbi:MAG: flap endonuclease-1 [Candidatus Altiarchaeales archaeon IMC4]|nr:MAG: flap endonuclease-1 [Candidatus Altiarchaeales archaeon IMC4]